MKKKIKDIINKAGIEDVGFCAFKLVEDKLLNCSARSRIPENAKTVIICLFPYKVKEEKPQFISRYAAVPDYHTVVTHYLSKVCTELHKHIDGYQFEYFVDNSPVPEVYAAAIWDDNRLISHNIVIISIKIIAKLIIFSHFPGRGI